MPNFCASNFDEYIEIQKLTNIADGFGGYTSTHTTRCFVWCLVTDTGGAESDIHGRFESTRSIEVMTNYRDDIVETDIILLDDREYNIRYIENVERKDLYLRLVAQSEQS